MPAVQASTESTVYTDEACPYAERVFMTLKELSVPHKTVFIDLGNKTEEYINLYQSVSLDPAATIRVPLYQDADGTGLIESLVIAEYLIRKYGKTADGLLPSDPANLAKVRLFVELFTGQFVPFFYKILRQPEQVQQHQEKLLHVMKVVDAHLRMHGNKSGSGFFLGEQYSLADIAATPHLKRMLVTLPELRQVDAMRMAEENGLSRLAAWMQAAVSRPSATAAIASNERLIQAAHEISKE